MGKLKTVTWLSVKSYNHSQITIALYVKINLTISKNLKFEKFIIWKPGCLSIHKVEMTNLKDIYKNKKTRKRNQYFILKF